jgi:PHD/YefM family antitoxin component YafN of YafNO toxin-antitoxin module
LVDNYIDIFVIAGYNDYKKVNTVFGKLRCYIMANSLPMSNILDALVPITRFNRGESNKIFDEVKADGYKIVVKNNVPACVLISPERYKALMEALEDRYLIALAEERERNGTGATIPFEDILAEDGLTLADLEDVPMEYGVDFE